MIAALAVWAALSGAGGTTSASPPPTAVAAAARRPPVSARFIAFGTKRKREMRAYAQRHYGLRTHLLRDPKVIVEHITVTPTLAQVIAIFSADRPDAELGERPGTCAHFVVDRDGTIAQLVSLRIMCRHTVGLNHRSIGIEHVAADDAELMGNARQLRASRRLTRWLQGRFEIARPDVIGHSESRSSPYHSERSARLRDQTHGDMRRATMERYRNGL